MNLFDLIEPAKQAPVPNDDWRPEAPPDLTGVNEVAFNFETNGLRWWEHHEPIALSIHAKGRSWYLPFKHAGGGNLPEEQVYRFAQEQLKGKLLYNINTRFDGHMGRVWGNRMGGGGLDFRKMGCKLQDVAHFAALLDDKRLRSSLDYLIPEYLKEKPMVRLDESRMATYSAGAAAPRAMYNVEAVTRLRDVMMPMLDAQGLQRVRQLEDDVIFLVLEMEKNGTLLDLEKLDRWVKESRDGYHHALMDLYKLTGLKVNPNSGKSQAELFRKLKLPMMELTDTGQPSFTDAVVKAIDHPAIKLLRRTKKLKSINSKLLKYRKCVDSKGILRYALHQLRASKSDDAESGETGTVVGRFTSTEIDDGVGVNIQQVLKPEKQFLTYGDEFFIRELHIPAPGMKWLAADAAQIQYRLFAHEAQNPKILQAYADDPWLSFHRLMHANLQTWKPDLSYKRCKDVNFAKLFAAGPSKIGFMLEYVTMKQYLELKAQKATRNHPWLKEVKEILAIYDKEVPEVQALTKSATSLADTRGYIKDILGRRMRFDHDENHKAIRGHKALNGRIIMSEASIVKTKGVELLNEAEALGILIRFQVHDEYDMDIPDDGVEPKVKTLLNRQSFKSISVPILWETNVGDSWGACAAGELNKMRADKELRERANLA